MMKSFVLKILSLILLFTIYLIWGCDSHNKNTQKDDSNFIKPIHAENTSTELNKANQQIQVSRETAITRAAHRAGPAVAGINVIQVKYVRHNPFYNADPLWRSIFPELFRDRISKYRLQNLGSGFLISSDGYLLTNEHVVEDGEEIVVTLPGGDRYDAKLMGMDRISDIALLKIDAEDLPYLELGTSSDLLIGEWVIALGNPFGLFQLNDQPTVTVGVISAIDRDWGRTKEGRIYMDLIQTDAAINHGNSGGPLVNSLGQVIGMNTFIYTGSRVEQGFVGIGFAIPTDHIIEVVNELKESGEVDRDYWLGFKVQNLNRQIARALGLANTNGVIVAEVEKGSSADVAGLRPEDVIVGIEGRSIKSTRDLLEKLSNLDLRVGDKLRLTVLKDKQEQEVTIKLIKRPEQR